MKQKYIFCGALGLMLLVSVCILNWKYEVIALHPFRSEGRSELTVMTWNVYCSEGTDSIRQRRIAELILQEDADFVLLNEYNQDSCAVTDSMLKTRYPYTEEYQSHRRCGDIFYSKRKMSNSGHVWIPIRGKSIQTIKATVETAGDSVQIFGVHMASNHYEGTSFGKEVKSDTTSYGRYRIAQENRCFQAHWTKEAVLESGHPVVVMGDMNDSPDTRLLRRNMNFGGGLFNLMDSLQKNLRTGKAAFGTHKFQGKWSVLDQFWVNGNLLPGTHQEDAVPSETPRILVDSIGVVCFPYMLVEDETHLGHRPKRTYSGYRYEGGFSDHLPIRLKLHIIYK